MDLFAKLTKVDEAQRLIYGRAVDETPDRSGEVFDYATSKPNFEKWSAETHDASDGQSFGNVRAMHGKVAAGKLTDIQFDDMAKSIDVVAKVIDDNEWKKVLEGVYTGFSIGGAYVKKWDDANVKKADGSAMKRYTANPSELSLVDRPCIPSAKFFDIQKADGAVEQHEFKAVLTDESVEAAARDLAKASGFDPDSIDTTNDINQPLWKAYADQAVEQLLAKDDSDDLNKREFTNDQREKLAEKGKAMSDGSFPISNKADLENAIKDFGRAKDPAAAKKHIIERATALKATDLLPADWDGSTAEKADTPSEYQVEGSDEEVAKLATIMHDEKLAMADVLKFVAAGIDLAKSDSDKTEILKVEADGKLKKGMYTVAQLAQIVMQLDQMRQSVVNEEQREGDTQSVLPTKAGNMLAVAVDLLRAMVEEESAELLNPDGDDDSVAPYLAMAHFGDLKKFGARNSAGDADRIKKMHDLAVELGAACGQKEASDHHAGLAKADVEQVVEMMLAKVREDNNTALAKLEATNNDLLAKVAHLAAQPAAPRGVLRAMNKGADLASEDQREQISPVVKNDQVNEAATLIKAMHHSGGVPMGLRPDGSSIL